MITLRDFTELEIEDEIRWMTTETEWIKADTPWESIEPIDADELRKELSDIVKESLEDFVWSRKEVFVDNHHIGFVSKYPLNTSEYVETFPLGNNGNNFVLRIFSSTILDIPVVYELIMKNNGLSLNIFIHAFISA